MDAFEQSASVYALAVAIAKNAGSREELGRLMEERGIRAFEIYASLGLTGFVLAEDVEVLP